MGRHLPQHGHCLATPDRSFAPSAAEFPQTASPSRNKRRGSGVNPTLFRCARLALATSALALALPFAQSEARPLKSSPTKAVTIALPFSGDVTDFSARRRHRNVRHVSKKKSYGNHAKVSRRARLARRCRSPLRRSAMLQPSCRIQAIAPTTASPMRLHRVKHHGSGMPSRPTPPSRLRTLTFAPRPQCAGACIDGLWLVKRCVRSAPLSWRQSNRTQPRLVCCVHEHGAAADRPFRFGL